MPLRFSKEKRDINVWGKLRDKKENRKRKEKRRNKTRKKEIDLLFMTEFCTMDTASILLEEIF